MHSSRLPPPLAACYRVARIRGTRVGRRDGRALGAFSLDSEVAGELGHNGGGVVIGFCSPTQAVRHIEALCIGPPGSAWVAIPWCKEFASEVRRIWKTEIGMLPVELTGSMGSRPKDLLWSDGPVWFSTPEKLRQLRKKLSETETMPAGILLVDPDCMLLGARRGFRVGRFTKPWDRPELVNAFRREAAIEGWMPPFVLVTAREVASLDAERIRSAYCLDQLIFLDGRSLAAVPLKDTGP